MFFELMIIRTRYSDHKPTTLGLAKPIRANVDPLAAFG
jgi:hypothetical protein